MRNIARNHKWVIARTDSVRSNNYVDNSLLGRYFEIETFRQVSLPNFKISCVGGWLIDWWWLWERFHETYLKDVTV